MVECDARRPFRHQRAGDGAWSVLWKYGALHVAFDRRWRHGLFIERLQYLLVEFEGDAVPAALGLDLGPLKRGTSEAAGRVVRASMSPLRLALVCALGLLLLTPQAALAGGWWSSIHLNRSTVAPGQRVQLDAVVDVGSDAAAEEAREPGRFHVYLLEGFDDSSVERAMSDAAPRSWWSLRGAEAMHVGMVTVNVPEAGLPTARAEFTVPELPPATYHVMLCDAGCAQPLADVVPVGFAVVADPATARMARRVDRLERRIRRQAGHLAGARADADRAGVTAGDARSEVVRLERRVSSVADDERGSPPAPWAYAGWLVAGTLAGALALLVPRRRQSRPPRSVRVGGWHPSDEEVRELLNSEPASRRLAHRPPGAGVPALSRSVRRAPRRRLPPGP